MKVLMLAFLAQVSVANQSLDETPVTLEPASDWTLEQGKYGCATRRSFGSPEKQTVLEFRLDEPMSGRFDIAITSLEFPLENGPFRATLRPDGVEYTPPLPGRERASSGALWTVWDHDLREASKREITGDEWDRYYKENGPDKFLKRIKTIEIEGLFNRDIVLPIGPVDGLRQQLRDCYDAVMMTHGLTKEDAKEDSRPVEFQNRQQIMLSMLGQLPADILRRISLKKQTHVSFVIFLDKDAEPTGCRLTTVPRYHDLEERGCAKIVSEGRFRFREGEEHRPAMVQAGFLYREDSGLRISGY